MKNIAVIGAGRIGKIHAGNAAAHPDLSVAYIVDPVLEAAAALAAQTGACVVSLDDALADSSIEGVIVASSTDTHLDFSMRAIESGKAVFCEKPIDLNLDKARGAAAVLGAADARFFLGFNRRFDPHFSRVHDEIRSGAMGPLETLHIISHDPAPPPIDYVRVSGGLFRDMTIHDFDMARWLLGEPIEHVYAAADCLVDPAVGEAGDVDTAKIILKTSSGKICVISNSRRSGYGYDQRIEAYCAKGLVKAGNVHATTVETWGEAGAHSAPLQNFFLDRYAQAYRDEMAHFAEILAGARPRIGFTDGLEALAIADAAASSHAHRAPVTISTTDL
jgi:myo-inositol 2-dehydrogenase/D-chiro-inositol 1-dehydrogenase